MEKKLEKEKPLKEPLTTWTVGFYFSILDKAIVDFVVREKLSAWTCDGRRGATRLRTAVTNAQYI